MPNPEAEVHTLPLPLSKARYSLNLMRGVDIALILMLGDLEAFVGKPLIVHLLRDPLHGNKLSQHRLGRACDFHLVDLHVMDQFFAASRFSFTGIGIYPFWNSPGLHCDIRVLEPGQPRALWATKADKTYTSLDNRFVEQIHKGAMT